MNHLAPAPHHSRCWLCSVAAILFGALLAVFTFDSLPTNHSFIKPTKYLVTADLHRVALKVAFRSALALAGAQIEFPTVQRAEDAFVLEPAGNERTTAVRAIRGCGVNPGRGLKYCDPSPI